jgi:hypothetical protein
MWYKVAIPLWIARLFSRVVMKTCEFLANGNSRVFSSILIDSQRLPIV